jgi:phospholipid/cholesterol/gamma-HCH transport system substrate-binding protein
MRRLAPPKTTPFKAGLLALIAVALISYFSFARSNPLSSPWELKAAFRDTVNVGNRSPVRIAGVEVGKVTRIEPAAEGSQASVVTMEIDRDALPIHDDARLKIRPRIFLEGNFVVDLQPGTPSAPTVKSGYTVPASQTAAPVQVDQVLGTLRANTRANLQKLVQGLGGAIGGEPQPGEDADQDRATRGETAGQALNDSLKDAPAALRGTSIVNDALLGSEPHDLSRLVAGQQKVSQALVSREDQLKDLITNFNVTAGALAGEDRNLRLTVRALPRLLERALPALEQLNRAFPPTRAFAREIIPGVRETPATISAALPWIAQTRRLVSPAELQGLVHDLSPSVRDLARATDGALALVPQVDLLDRCLLDVVLPTGDVRIQDPPFTTGIENYKELFQGLVGLTGESQNFDGNGQYTRFQTGGGDTTIQANGPAGPGYGNATRPPLGTRPAYPGKAPPFRTDVACHRNRPPDLNSARTGRGP